MRLSIGVANICLCTFLVFQVQARSQAPAANSTQKGASVSLHAAGTFDVKISPLPPEDSTGGAAIGRYSIDKQFHGDLEGVSKGLMLGAGDPSTGTAGYVAMEYVTGTLHGRSGSFALQHMGTMDSGKFDLKVIVAPGSGKGELAGIQGTMTITNAAGKHSYEFDYSLPEPTK
jgi:hypothetical protein